MTKKKDNVDNTINFMEDRIRKEKKKKNKRSKVGLENVNHINKQRDSIFT